jgi:hypothetical protein
MFGVVHTDALGVLAASVLRALRPKTFRLVCTYNRWRWETRHSLTDPDVWSETCWAPPHGRLDGLLVYIPRHMIYMR